MKLALGIIAGLLISLFLPDGAIQVFASNTLQEKSQAVNEASAEENNAASENQTSGSFSLTKIPKANINSQKTYASEKTSAETENTQINQPLVDKNPFRDTGQSCDGKNCNQATREEAEVEEEVETESETVPTTLRVCHGCNAEVTVATTTEVEESAEDTDKRSLPATGGINSPLLAAIPASIGLAVYFLRKSRVALKNSLANH